MEKQARTGILRRRSIQAGTRSSLQSINWISFVIRGVAVYRVEEEDASVECLTIMGGDGVYWLGLSAGKYEQLRLFDPSKGSHEVQLWTSDQGFADQEMYVTYDRELVLRIARYFGETGEPLAEAMWESH